MATNPINHNKKIKINITIKYDQIPIGINEEFGTLLKDAKGKINFSFNNKFKKNFINRKSNG